VLLLCLVLVVEARFDHVYLTVKEPGAQIGSMFGLDAQGELRVMLNVLGSTQANEQWLLLVVFNQAQWVRSLSQALEIRDLCVLLLASESVRVSDSLEQ